MRNFYITSSLFTLLLLSGCSKDILKSYDQRIVGAWEITDIDRYGFSSNDNLPFEEDGMLTFTNDGDVIYSYDGTDYKGSWDIIRVRISDDETQRALQLNVIDFTGQRVLSEYFHNIQFTGTDRFTAFIEYGTRIYVYRFRR
jgi:hypothetical protein